MSSESNSSPHISEDEQEIESESSVVDYNDDLDPVATEEETQAYAEEIVREEEQEQEALRRFSRESDINSW